MFLALLWVDPDIDEIFASAAVKVCRSARRYGPVIEELQQGSDPVLLPAARGQEGKQVVGGHARQDTRAALNARRLGRLAWASPARPAWLLH